MKRNRTERIQIALSALAHDDLPIRFSRVDMAKAIHAIIEHWYSPSQVSKFITLLVKRGVIERVYIGKRRKQEYDLYSEVRTRRNDEISI